MLTTASSSFLSTRPMKGGGVRVLSVCLPVSKTTSCCFGGPTYSDLYRPQITVELILYAVLWVLADLRRDILLDPVQCAGEPRQEAGQFSVEQVGLLATLPRGGGQKQASEEDCLTMLRRHRRCPPAPRHFLFAMLAVLCGHAEHLVADWMRGVEEMVTLIQGHIGHDL
ncbi:hypothetical protein CRUP_021574 [Coryphaenoides rupestris]|nr:hypothetical protein CRUP_021574 [Coryphaenoides rupestris]